MLREPNRAVQDTAPTSPQPTGRHDRPSLIAFVTDAASERAIHDGLTDRMRGTADIRRGGVRAAIASMERGTTPMVLIVDVSDEDQPLTALGHLANVAEPDVCVLVIGDLDSVDFYREVTRSLGAHDYVAKPLTTDKVTRHLVPLLVGEAPSGEGAHGGGLVMVTGVSGGVGATTIAVNLAGHFGISMHRHTVLLDPDLYLGDVAFLLNIKPGPGLRMALESPERIDSLLAERAAQPAADRLHVLAGEEPLAARLNYAPNATAVLLMALRRRYNFIVADVPCRQAPLYDDLLRESHQRVLVMSPTLAAVRHGLRHLALASATMATKRPVIVLNRLGCPGGLTRRQVEDALAVKVDVAIPDLPRQVCEAATMGEMVKAGKGGFRNGIIELARHVAFIGLLDSIAGAALVQPREGTRGLRRLFRAKS